jgi:hypothetical protein
MKYDTILPDSRITGGATNVRVNWARLANNEIEVHNVVYTEKGVRKKAFDEKMIIRIFFNSSNVNTQKTVTAADFSENTITIIAQ